MRKKYITFLWFLFLIIPLVYFFLKNLLSGNGIVEYIMTLAPYIFAVMTIMYKVDINFYFLIKRIIKVFNNNNVSWVLSIRYDNILTYDKLLLELQNILTEKGYKILKKENDFLSILWEARHIFNYRIESRNINEYSLHFYTTKMDVPVKSHERKIRELSSLLDIVENKINMIDRNQKYYEMEIDYPEKSPYYSYWVRTIPAEKVKIFSCKIIIGNNDDIIDVNKNQIRIYATSLTVLFQKVNKYITLKGV